MAVPFHQLDSLLREAFPMAKITLIDLAGDDDHYQVTIEEVEFNGKSRVQQHQMVYAALKGKMGGELHALAVITKPLPQL
jgi:stress-induced morphogen